MKSARAVIALIAFVAFAVVALMYFKGKGVVSESKGSKDAQMIPKEGVNLVQTEREKNEVSSHLGGSANDRLAIEKKELHHSAPPTPLSSPLLRENLVSLKESAESGNTDSAYTLATELFKCKRLEVQYDELKNQVTNSPNDKTQLETLKNSLDELDSKLSNCSGVSVSDIDSYAKWLEYAAIHGNTSAQRDYPSLLSTVAQAKASTLDTDWLNEYKSKSMMFLEDSAYGGNVDALVDLSMAYWDGYLTTKDRVSAYSYMKCAADSGMVKMAQNSLTFFSKSMSPDEINMALARATVVCP